MAEERNPEIATRWLNYECKHCLTWWRVLLHINTPVKFELVDTMGKSAKKCYDEGKCKCFGRKHD